MATLLGCMGRTGNRTSKLHGSGYYRWTAGSFSSLMELSHFCHTDLFFTMLKGLSDERKKIVNDMHMGFVFDPESVGKLHAEITRFMVCSFDYDASSGVLKLGKSFRKHVH